MENFSYIALSRQMALENLMDVTANNMANMNTPGYKSTNVLFQEYLNKAGAHGTIGQVETVGNYRDTGQGTLSRTNNPLDVALQGKGYFAVQAEGGTRYTRDGSFTLNARGELVTAQGFSVESDGGSTITVPQGATSISIADNGTVSTNLGTAGKIRVTDFENESALTPIGNNLYEAGGASEKAAEKILVVQGMVENSNVNPVLEMNKMIQVLRMYQNTQNMIGADHEMSMNMINKLTKN